LDLLHIVLLVQPLGCFYWNSCIQCFYCSNLPFGQTFLFLWTASLVWNYLFEELSYFHFNIVTWFNIEILLIPFFHSNWCQKSKGDNLPILFWFQFVTDFIPTSWSLFWLLIKNDLHTLWILLFLSRIASIVSFLGQRVRRSNCSPEINLLGQGIFENIS